MNEEVVPNIEVELKPKSVDQALFNDEDDDAIQEDVEMVEDEVSAKVQPILDSSTLLDLEAGRKYLSLIEKIKMIASGISHAMMSMGDVGVGKSTLIKDTLLSEGLQEGRDFVFVRGYSTPMALYEKLYQNRESGKIIIIDDCDVVLKNKTCLDLLKAVLDDKYKRIVNYETRRKGSELPKSFVFTGRVIFITNYKPKEDDVHFLAIQDRCIVQRLYLSPREKLEYIEKILVPSDYKNTTTEVRKQIYGLMRDCVVQGGIHFSYRTFFQILDFHRHDPSNLTLHLGELLPFESEVMLLLRLMKEKPDDSKYWLTKFMEQTGKSRRTYFNVLSKARGIIPQHSNVGAGQETLL